jgi:site-specific DNA recombinase
MGYRFARVPGHGGKMMVVDEPVARVVVGEALEGYASGRFETQNEVRLFLESSPHLSQEYRNGTVHFQKVTNLLGKVLYAGYMNIPEWGMNTCTLPSMNR